MPEISVRSASAKFVPQFPHLSAAIRFGTVLGLYVDFPNKFDARSKQFASQARLRRHLPSSAGFD